MKVLLTRETPIVLLRFNDSLTTLSLRFQLRLAGQLGFAIRTLYRALTDSTHFDGEV